MPFTIVPISRGFSEIAALFDFIGSAAVICGGYARYAASPNISPAAAGDVDVYAKSNEEFDSLAGRMKEVLEVKRESPIAITFRPTTSGVLAYVPEVQLVKPVVRGRVKTGGEADEILSNFDFTVARAAVVGPTSALVDIDFIADETSGRLRLKNIHCPISSTLRCIKYVQKGYRLHPMDVLPLFLDWDSRDEAYRAELIQGLADIAAFHAEEREVSDERLSAIYELMSID